MFYEKVKDKKFWKQVRTDERYGFLIDQAKELYEEYGTGDIKALNYDAFMDYHRTGNRNYFEEKYFSRRKRLVACALLALIYPENEEYLRNLQNTIWAICDEYCWSLPCHTKSSDVLFDNNYLDLFASETGQALSEIRYLLGDRLEVLINERIHNEIQHRVIDSFINRTFSWEQNTHNWVAVCGGSIAMTFMLERPDLFDSVKHRIASAIQNYIDAFQDDGVCLEGFSYWTYGFGYFCCYAQALLEFTKGEINLFANEKVKRIAHFPSYAFVSGNASVSFSDGGRAGSLAIGISSLVEYHYGNILPRLSKESYRITDHCGRFAEATRAFVFFDPDSFGEISEQNATHYLKDSGWFVSKNARYGFATKAGHNDEPHNHNDIGSFIFAAKGQQLLCDLGCGAYNADYFGAKRYTILCNRSMGHSVPILDGQEQQAGKEFCGTLSYDGRAVTIDMIEAYPSCSVSKLTRKFTLTDDGVTLTDSFGYHNPCPVTERFISCIAPKQNGNTIILGDAALICPVGWHCSISTQKHATHGLYDGSETVYLLDFTPQSQGETEFVLTMALCQ